VARRGRALLFASGGTTAMPLLAALGEQQAGRRVPWERIEVLLVDERCHAADAASNLALVRRELLDRLPRAPRAMHAISAELDAAGAAVRYATILRAVLGERGRPDVVLLGLGADGHSASLFPGQDWMGDGWVVAGRAPQAPRERVSLALPLLARTRTLVLFVTGEAKAEAVGRLAAGEDLPAARLRPGRLVWVLDAAAASRIPRIPPCSRVGP
jgi:6-phosphogluconolactonase